MKERILIIGYGNPGRLDDGLGTALAKAIESWQLEGVSTDADYQLTVEDSAAVAKHDLVIFADASVTGEEAFEFSEMEPESGLSFSSHSISPNAVLGLANDLFGAYPKSYLLSIRGYEFNEFGEKLSPKATENLEKALGFIKRFLEDRLRGELELAAGEHIVNCTTRAGFE